MEKTQSTIRTKNSFTIEDILSRPDNSEKSEHRELQRQNPFQNNHVLFCGKTINHICPHLVGKKLMVSEESDKNIETICNEDHIIQDQDQETNSEAASDDGNSSIHSECYL